MLGDGKASAGSHGRGAGRELFFQSLLDSGGGLGGLPLDLGDLFEEAYQAGARIHNNSWGAATASTYTMNSNEVDEFVADARHAHRDLGGQRRSGRQPRNTQTGMVDWLSIGAPASAKNALTVGAAAATAATAG